MERKFVRQYENFDTVIPKIEDFPILNNNLDSSKTEEEIKINSISGNELKIDDLILLGIIAVLLMEKEKNLSTILLLGLIFISDYIF